MLTGKYPKPTEPTRSQLRVVWATWLSEHPMGSTGSLEEPSLNWILLKTKSEFWGGGQPLSHPCPKHLTSQCLSTPRFLQPLNSPGKSDSSSAGNRSLGHSGLLASTIPTAAPLKPSSSLSTTLQSRS